MLPQVAQQRSLIELNLGGTKLKELPSAMGDLSDLEVLDIGSSEIHSLMPSLGELKNLPKLVIRHYLLHELIFMGNTHTCMKASRIYEDTFEPLIIDLQL